MLVLVQTRKTGNHPDMTEKLLIGTQTSKQIFSYYHLNITFGCLEVEYLQHLFWLRTKKIIKGITVLKIFIWGGILSDIRLEI